MTDTGRESRRRRKAESWLNQRGIMTALEAAERLGVSRSTVYARIRRGLLDVVEDGPPLLLSAASVDDYLERTTNIHAYQTSGQRDGWQKCSSTHRARHQKRHRRADFLRKLYPGRAA